MVMTRRGFALGSAAFAGLAVAACGPATVRSAGRPGLGYGPLRPDPAGLFDLPEGFSYRVISRFGERMDDGFAVPDRADGMGAFALDNRRVALVRNHELRPSNQADGPFRDGDGTAANPRGFDAAEGLPLPGGTTTIIYDYRAGRVESQYLSLCGTIRNCAGGTTPWGSWLTCEEDVSRAGSGLGRDHGWVFEVPASARGLADPVPLTALGRFNHEAAAVDPRTGIVYLTEDRADGLFYRLLPERRGELRRGGRLQALAFAEADRPADSRNAAGVALPIQQWQPVRWIDLDEVESPQDDLRTRGHARGAVLFARGEGILFADGDLYFCCTSGGAAGLGQVVRYRPSRREGQSDEHDAAGRLQIFVESTDPATLNYCDNLTLAPTGHLILCEDQGRQPQRNHLRGVDPDGAVYPLALLHEQTELAGACFSPDGAIMFVNLYHPTRTLAITGPWRAVAG
jgi:secreted PhoX family phosphatase